MYNPPLIMNYFIRFIYSFLNIFPQKKATSVLISFRKVIFANSIRTCAVSYINNYSKISISFISVNIALINFKILNTKS